MKIERIRTTNLTGLGNVDWRFPVGPGVVFVAEKSQQKMFAKLVRGFLYDLNDLEPLDVSKAQCSKGLAEVWMTSESTHLQIRREFILHDDDGQIGFSTLVIEDETGQGVSLPESMTLGAYLFQLNLQAFCQGGFVEWPEREERDLLFRRIRNLRQGGDEGLSLSKVLASIAGAQRRVEDQKESIAETKAEYDALRGEWEAAHRRQEEERLLQIEMKNLREKEKILATRIGSTSKLQDRLTILRQNPDYRELRRLQGELTRLEERFQVLEGNVKALTSESQVDWTVIEGLREGCMEWARLQENVERIGAKAQTWARKIIEVTNSLQTSGYQGLSKDEDQRLHRAQEEMHTAQEELNRLTLTNSELQKVEIAYKQELAILQNLEDFAKITEADELKIEHRERRLTQWQSSKISGFFDFALQELLGMTSINKRLVFRLTKYYQKYRVSNFKEFKRKIKEFRGQQQRVERMRTDLEKLQESVRRGEKLLGVVHSRTKILKQAFISTNTADYPAWLNGWNDYWAKDDQLALWNNELQLALEQQRVEETKLQGCAEQLHGKLENWGVSATDRDEVLAAVLSVASQLREKDKTEREFAESSRRFSELLGDRTMDRLSKSLEPLAELERETYFTDEERLAELAAWNNELMETCLRRVKAERQLQYNQGFPILSVLERKIEAVKGRLKAYETLNCALDDALALLEASFKEWQTEYGKVLEEESQWIFSQISPLHAQMKTERDMADVKKNYFAYRMAMVQLTLRNQRNYAEVPLFFSIGEIHEDQGFWDDVTTYLQKLSISRQVVLCTSDSKLSEMMGNVGWQRLGALDWNKS
ncbi:hypothetical protein [Desulfosporosinus sp. Sb-LF]|uniref:hypothetical protein n=1 Tax=Desulfosporosinus sp. Sb-LF TaxID=2560027 RepID=UPI00107F84BC|nr:hypothetical protein [Desulfosporosinus sp. Sb-LF]TGE31687.1 hypothetical protein E4K68_15855 [Desulfosporosinus sp. Sb-LF]